MAWPYENTSAPIGKQDEEQVHRLFLEYSSV